VVVAEKESKLSSTLFHKEKCKRNTYCSLPFSGIVIALAADVMWDFHTNVPTASPSRGSPWYRKICCADGATGLSRYNLGSSFHEMRKINQTRRSREAEGPVRKVRDVVPHQHAKSGALCCTSGEANRVSAKCFDASQSYETRARQAGSLKAHSNSRAFNCRRFEESIPDKSAF